MSGSVEEKLYEAAEDGRVSAVSSLLRHPEINVNWTNEDHWTPLHAASWNGHVEVVKLLLAHPNIDVNVRNEYGETPLSLGCEYGHVSVVEVLLKDPRVDLTLDDIDGCTPLWWASYEGHHKVIESLLASGRDLGDIMNKKGKTLMMAKTTPPLKLQDQEGELRLCHCLKDSWPIQYRPAMSFV